MGPITSALSLGSGISGYFAAKNQARATERATQAAIAEQRAAREQMRADLEPYRGAGQYGVDSLVGGLQSGQYDAPEFGYQSPGAFSYNAGADNSLQQALAESSKALQASAAARGVLGGGGVLRAMNREAMGQTSQFEDKAYNRFQNEDATNYVRATDTYNRVYGAKQDQANRLMSLGNMGLGAASQGASMGMQAAGNIGNLGISGATNAASLRGQGQQQLWSGLGSGLGMLEGQTWNNPGTSLGTRAGYQALRELRGR